MTIYFPVKTFYDESTMGPHGENVYFEKKRTPFAYLAVGFFACAILVVLIGFVADDLFIFACFSVIPIVGCFAIFLWYLLPNGVVFNEGGIYLETAFRRIDLSMDKIESYSLATFLARSSGDQELHLHYRLKIYPQEGEPFRVIAFSFAEGDGRIDFVERLRTVIAGRIALALRRDRRVIWSPEVHITDRGLEYATDEFERPVLLPLAQCGKIRVDFYPGNSLARCITALKWFSVFWGLVVIRISGTVGLCAWINTSERHLCRIYRPGERVPLIEVDTAVPNFYPVFDTLKPMLLAQRINEPSG